MFNCSAHGVNTDGGISACWLLYYVDLLIWSFPDLECKCSDTRAEISGTMCRVSALPPGWTDINKKNGTVHQESIELINLGSETVIILR